MSELPKFKPSKVGEITGYADAIKLKFDKSEVTKLASVLKSIGHFDGSVSNQEGTKKSLTTVRLDRQSNTSEKAANLQIQVNDQNARHTTIGQVLVSQAAFKAANEHPMQPEASEKLLAAFSDAMLKGHKDGQSYEIGVA